jgi:hypothetical protein
MYLYQTITDKANMQDGGNFIPVFNPDHIAQADKMEVWATDMNDTGNDYTVFKLMIGDKIIAQKTKRGY